MANWMAWVVLTTLILDFILDVVATRLNLRAVSTEIPAEFKGVYQEESYLKSQEYLKQNTRLGTFSSVYSLVILLAFWFSGGFNWLDEWVRSWGWSMIPTGLAFIVLLMLGQSLLGLPFSIYRTFVTEARFGFNTTTWARFLKDMLLGLGLSLVLGLPLIALVLWFLDIAGTFAWLYIWASILVYTLVVQYVAPTWIMPLFNKFEPLPEGELKTAILNMAEKQQFPLQGLYVMDGSKRSKKSNAFFTGFGKNKRIVLFDTLIANHSIDELVAVLAHEIGHYKKKHIVKGLVTGALNNAVMLLVMQYLILNPLLFEAFYVKEASLYAGLIFFFMLYSPLGSIFGIWMNVTSRKHEFEADAFAVQATGQHQPMIDALKKLSVDNLSNLTPHPFYVFMNYSHPPVLQRIEAIRQVKI